MKKYFLLSICLSVYFFSVPLNQNLYSQWVELTSGVSTNLTSISVPNPNVRWVCGYNGTVLKSVAFPISFSIANNGIPPNVNLYNIFGNNEYRALCAGNIGSNTYVYRTSNGGGNWMQVFNQSNGSINAIWLWDTLNGIMVGNPVGGRWSIWRTSNAGSSWDSTGLFLQQSGSETGWNNSLYFMDSSYSNPLPRLWFGTNNSRIYYSTNFGNNWIALSTSPESNSISFIFQSFYANGSGYVGGTNLIQTTNYGYNWTTVNNTLGSGNITGLAGNNGGVDMVYPYSWYLRSDNKIYYSENSGMNWTIQYTAPNGIYRYMGQAWPGGNGQIFAVRDNGGISYCSCIPSGIKKPSNNIPESYSLDQNYPNPFNPSTKIKFDIAPLLNQGGVAPKQVGDRVVTLKIYDLLGREVAILVNEQLKPGTYEVNFDGTNFSSGVYFYQLKADEFMDTKKLILMK
jgi:hypothetical protein